RFRNVPPMVGVRPADPNPVVRFALRHGEEADEVRTVGRPVKYQSYGPVGKHLARSLRGQVVLEQRLPSAVGVLDVKNAIADGMPADGEIGSDAADVIALRLEQRNRLGGHAVLRLVTQPTGVEDGVLAEEHERARGIRVRRERAWYVAF